MSMIQLLNTFFNGRKTKQKFYDCLLSNLDWDFHHVILITVSQINRTQASSIINMIKELTDKHADVKFSHGLYSKTIHSRKTSFTVTYKVNFMLWIESKKHECIKFQVRNVFNNFEDSLILWNDLAESTDYGEDDRLLKKYIRQIADIVSPPSHKLTLKGYQLVVDRTPIEQKIRLRLPN